MLVLIACPPALETSLPALEHCTLPLLRLQRRVEIEEVRSDALFYVEEYEREAEGRQKAITELNRVKAELRHRAPA